MKNTPTPHVATAVTVNKAVITFGPSGSPFPHLVEVPAGTRCRKLDGGSEPWVVADLAFIADKRSMMYSDADIYGIRIPETNLTNIEPVPRKFR